MSHYVEIVCPSCDRKLRIRRQYVGLEVACRHCDHRFVVQGADEAAEPDTAPESRPIESASGPTTEAAARIAALESELEQLRSEIAHQSTEHAETVERLEEAGLQCSSLRSQLQELERQLELALEQPQQSGDTQQVQGLPQSEFEQFFTDAESAESGSVAVDRLTQELEAARAEADRLRVELANSAKDIETVRAECDRLKIEYEVTSTEAQAFRAKLMELERSPGVATDPSAHERIEQLTRQLNLARAECNEYSSLLDRLGISLR